MLRRALKIALLAAAAAAQGCAPTAAANPQPDQPWKTLAPPGLAVGGAVQTYSPHWNSPDSDNMRSVIERDFNTVTGAAYLAFGVWPDPAQPLVLDKWDALIAYAKQRQLRVHGHVLVYPHLNTFSPWYRDLSPDQIESILRAFVQDLARSHAGDVWAWDVVNEVLADDGEPMDADGLRTHYAEYSAIGPDYVRKAFAWAKEADPNALLIFNEYGVEESNAKATRLLNYVVKLRSQGVPIDGVGFQMHWLRKAEPNYGSIRANIRRFEDAGVPVFITELDAPAGVTKQPEVASPPPARLNRQRRIFYNIARIAAEEPNCRSLLLWDFVDQHSWLHPVESDFGELKPGDYTFPTPFHEPSPRAPLIPKPAYHGVQQGLHEAEASFRISTASDPDLFLGRVARESGDGSLRPAYRVQLLSVGDAPMLSGLRWTLEQVETDVYRIRCEWNARRGYLTRDVTVVGDQLLPRARVVMREFLDEPRQMWFLAPLGDHACSLINRWRPDNGTLVRKRRRIVDASGRVRRDPTNEAILVSPVRRSLQGWTLRQVR